MLITYTSTPTLDNVLSVADLKSFARVDAADDDAFNASNVLTELPSSSYYYEFANGQGRISWYNTPDLYSYAYNRIKITFSVGYAEASVPEAILHALRLLVSHYYENRMTVVVGRQANDVPMTVASLLSQYRKL